MAVNKASCRKGSAVPGCRRQYLVEGYYLKTWDLFLVSGRFLRAEATASIWFFAFSMYLCFLEYAVYVKTTKK